MSDSLNAYLTESRAKADAQQHRRHLIPHHSDGMFVTRASKRLLSFGSNDYLGLGSDHAIHMPESASLTGAGGSRLVGGNHLAYAAVEQQLAKMKGRDTSLIFSSGYLANIGAITALMSKGDLILMDRLSHACMIDGVRLSGASFKRYHHNDMTHLEILLRRHRSSARHCLLLTETVFSMDGDCAPLAEMRALAERYDCWLMSDDAHGFGITNAPNPSDIITGSFSKAVGMVGGYVCGGETLRDYLINYARPLLFSTALPKAVIEAIGSRLCLMQKESWRRTKVMGYARQITEALQLPEAASAIIPYLLGENNHALACQHSLETNHHIWIPAIRPPTIPNGTARLRISLSAAHSQEHIERLIDGLKSLI